MSGKLTYLLLEIRPPPLQNQRVNEKRSKREDSERGSGEWVGEKRGGRGKKVQNMRCEAG